ncbi:4-carboxymuconolactone decarboxylase [Hydrocarboniphaga daqingensis]|uniref:4-carboxymuconolactone decarboxylase n=1 Tax=Hydrocarboniphaga daqingensis TaxID=490188 RepID=A0A1M5PRY3_9GAMM|nr:carboxymuconolactone decarboxylase family protein [Hydrocarboniphaga daqingensis]SHH04289.1 4-carboxymuconolactone decarboxylase [Hydrocarboniphaga daqingensis]
MNPRYDRDKGMQMFDTVYCGDVPIPTAPGESRFIDYMLETLFGTLWADQDSLSIRDRRLLLIGAIAAIGDETTLAIQTRSALKRGELDPSQLDSISMFLTQYVGYPLGSRLHRVFSQLRAEIASAGVTR